MKIIALYNILKFFIKKSLNYKLYFFIGKCIVYYCFKFISTIQKYQNNYNNKRIF